MKKSNFKFLFMYDYNKTPMENALNQIKTCAIAGFFSAGITLLVIIFYASGNELIKGINLFSLVDVVLMLVLTLLVLLAKSRIASCLLFLYFVANKVVLAIDNPKAVSSGIYMTIFFLMAFFSGVLGTFRYQKIKKLEKQNEPNPYETSSRNH